MTFAKGSELFELSSRTAERLIDAQSGGGVQGALACQGEVPIRGSAALAEAGETVNQCPLWSQYIRQSKSC